MKTYIISFSLTKIYSFYMRIVLCKVHIYALDIFLYLNITNIYLVYISEYKKFLKPLVFQYILDFIFRITRVDIYIIFIRLYKFKRPSVGSEILDFNFVRYNLYIHYLIIKRL